MATFDGHCEFCVICAKPDELAELIQVFNKHFERIRGTGLADRVYQETKSGNKIKVTTCSTMGNMTAAIRTAHMISMVQPEIAIFLGTAASLRPSEVQIGDVVIPRRAICRIYEKVSEKGQSDYDERAKLIQFKEYLFDNALISETFTIDCSPDALAAVSALNINNVVLDSGDLGSIDVGSETYNLRPSKIHRDVDTFSCGMVIDSLSYRSFIADYVSMGLRKTSIIEMESFGFFTSIDVMRTVGAGTNCSGIMIRGISDYAGRKSATEKRPDGWKDKAVRNAAVAAAALIEELCSIPLSLPVQSPSRQAAL